MKKREGVKAGRRPQDPAESWELPYTERQGGFYFRGIYAGHPFAPSGPEDVPAGAWESLRETCGLESLKQLLIIPSSVRSVGRRNRKVITPMEVLAVGTRAVGLWVEKPAPAVRVAIDLDELAALEDVHILLYGRLSFLSRDNRLTIRYNTVCRRILEPVLQRLREKLAGPGCPVPSWGSPTGPLPFKWNFLLQYPFTTLDPEAPRVFGFQGAPRVKGAWVPRGHLLILTPFELVSLRDPVESFHSYGVDSLFIPRSRIQAVSVQPDGVQVTAKGAELFLPLPPTLLVEVRRWFETSKPGIGSEGAHGPREVRKASRVLPDAGGITR